MNAIHRLLIAVPLLIAPGDLPRVPPPDPSVVRVEGFLQVWSACDSFAAVCRTHADAESDAGERNLRFALSVYWTALRECYRTLEPAERTAVWRHLAPWDPVSGQRSGEALLAASLRTWADDTPALPRRLARQLRRDVADDLRSRGVDATLLPGIFGPWAGFRDPARTPPPPRWRFPVPTPGARRTCRAPETPPGSGR